MRIDLNKWIAAFAVIVLIATIIWLTRSCYHKPIESNGTIFDSLKYYKDLAKQKRDSIPDISEQKYNEIKTELLADSPAAQRLRDSLLSVLTERARQDSIREGANRPVR